MLPSRPLTPVKAGLSGEQSTTVETSRDESTVEPELAIELDDELVEALEQNVEIHGDWVLDPDQIRAKVAAGFDLKDLKHIGVRRAADLKIALGYRVAIQMTLHERIDSLNELFFDTERFAEDVVYVPNGNEAKRFTIPAVVDWDNEEGNNQIRGSGRTGMNEDRGRSVRASVIVELPTTRVDGQRRYRSG